MIKSMPPGLALNTFINIHDKVDMYIHGPEGRVHLPTYVKDILSDARLILDIPDQPNYEQLLTPGTSVEIGFLLQGLDTLPALETRVVRYEPRHVQGCWVQLPPDAMAYFMGRRRHVRLPIVFMLQVFEQAGSEKRPIYAESVNLSPGGIRFVSTRVFNKGERVQLQFQPDVTAPIFQLTGNVLLSKPSETQTFQSAPETFTSVEFTSVSQDDEARLVALCVQWEKDNKSR